ncbi:chromosome segregation protein [Syncephalis fuscata]|nr:chromosome segregation protein [Syncephalis fuscata]
MYIREITIHGFKSYKEPVVVNTLSPHHNVVVGRNGAGKSNFFAAIRFLLSDAYTQLSREERQALLHEGGVGPSTMSAYVEVIFDNSDQRFPTGKDEVVIRRTIGLKEDEYSLDRKSSSKTEVINLLESAGFSRSNPYYIVPQGRITALTQAKDSERLQLLKEVAGTQVYETRRQESVKIMEDTESKRNKIEELLVYIEERLVELEKEKEDLKIFYDLDRERRCLEYTMHQREQLEVGTALDEIEENRRIEMAEMDKQRSELIIAEQSIAEKTNEITQLQQKLDLISSEKQDLLEEKEGLLKRYANTELLLKDYTNQQSNEQEEQQETITVLNNIQRTIQVKEKELAVIEPNYEQVLQQVATINEQLDQIQLERQTLLAKQGRNAQFDNEVLRNVWINEEITRLEQIIQQRSSQIEESSVEMQELSQQLTETETAAAQSIKTLDEQGQQLEQMTMEAVETRRQRDTMTEERKQLWREEAQSSSTMATIKDESQQWERLFASLIDRDTSYGLKSVEKYTQLHGISGVYGPLYTLFEVDDVYRTAVEVIAGSSLFHVVVDTDDTAMRLLEAMHQNDNGHDDLEAGRITFMPLNQLESRMATSSSMDTTFESRDAKPIIKRLRYDARFESAMHQIFGRAVICPNLEIASQYAKEHGLNAVTLEGDRAERKGALTGGYHDHRKSKLEAAKKMSQLRTQLQEHEIRQSQMKQSLHQLDQALTDRLSRLQQLEIQRRQMKEQREPLTQEMVAYQRKAMEIKEMLKHREQMLQEARKGVKTLEAQWTAYKTELTFPFTCTLTEEESTQLQQLTRSADELRLQLTTMTTQQHQLVTTKQILESELTDGLYRRRDHLSLQLDRIKAHMADRSIQEERQQELMTAQVQLSTINDRTAVVEGECESIIGVLSELMQQLEQLQEAHDEELRTMERQQQQTERFVAKRSLLQRKKEACVKRIRDLGILPEEAFEKYQETALNELLEMLQEVNEQLKTHRHVNKKAFEQFTTFTKQKDTLHQRKQEVDASAASIQQLIDVLDQRKHEAIERSFKQIAKYFSEMFEKLVPNGQGQLVMQRQADSMAADSQDMGPVDTYTGIAIKVTFDRSSEEAVRMQQLSGGQKSVVALALIFAIQRCDPAPFYLFDEIDANLDAAYRTAVAELIHELSQEAQFVTTTFRPEMLTHANKFLGVSFASKVSRVLDISQAEAIEFIEQEPNA